MNENNDIKTPKITKVAQVIDEYTIVINKGSKNKISKGDTFLIYRLGEEILDPDTKETLGTLEIVVGTGKVEHVQDSIATLTSCKCKKTRSKTIRKLPLYMGTEEIVEDPEILPFDNPRVGDLAKRI